MIVVVFVFAVVGTSSSGGSVNVGVGHSQRYVVISLL